VKKGGAVKHARGGAVEGSKAEERTESKAFERKEDRGTHKFNKGGMVGGSDTKARVRAGRDNM
jgi:hypothetical protein